MRLDEREPAISVRDVTHVQGSGARAVQALGGVDLDVRAGEFVCVLGPSGCGKSTLLSLLAGHEVPTAGHVTAWGKPIDGPSPERALVTQQSTLFPWITVGDNVGLGLKFAKVPREERRRRVGQILSLVGLADVAAQYPYELSGGMQQRCQIARALVMDPAILLMDEPFSALDERRRQELQGELLRLVGDSHSTVVFVTHSIDEALRLGSRVVVLTGRPARVALDADVDPGNVDDHRSARVRTVRRQVTDALQETHRGSDLNLV